MRNDGFLHRLVDMTIDYFEYLCRKMEKNGD